MFLCVGKGGLVGTCQSLTGAFFDDVGVIDNIPPKEYNKKGVWCMFEKG